MSPRLYRNWSNVGTAGLAARPSSPRRRTISSWPGSDRERLLVIKFRGLGDDGSSRHTAVAAIALVRQSPALSLRFLQRPRPRRGVRSPEAMGRCNKEKDLSAN